jgi:uncharacterized protein (TIGR02679 family)
MAHTNLLAYFSQPGFRRLLDTIIKKYRSLGRIGGKIQLRNLTSVEKEALSGFLGRNLDRQLTLTADVAEVDRIIRESRFATSLEELLRVYFREELKSNREMLEEQHHEWEQFFNEIEPLAIREKTRAWLQTIKEGKEFGYRTFLKIYQADSTETARALKICLRALDELPVLKGERCRRPVFAARLTGNPHGFDRETWAGRLFYFGILYVLGIYFEDGWAQGTTPVRGHRAEIVRDVFYRAGLEEDDLSSNVIVAGLRAQEGDPRSGLLNGAYVSRSPLILPLRFFDQRTNWDLFKHVFVVENPTVFSAILDAWNHPGCPPLICTSGQPSVAALRLMDELTATGVRLCYSGDFDGKGLEMGVGLYFRYREAFEPWFFDASAYEEAAAGIPLSQKQRKRLGSLKVPWDSQLGEKMLERGYVVYQEVLVEEMVKDLQRREE